ncbi:hypothetical protein HER10_EVM0001329 [Colletotrichum scovillei]|uniref:Uncharacterized protein n=1 Tax=Colletotrichum scovillei TaxID=1209932 RepID=A0A9P7RGC4_9PEZI|nr:uncharacterized protein HER10_EVM0001329 [Colletotrichum scovillei]KAF4784978.1 hypothetical protein HER10_EVM0001329 [Colletotrichum scovillei]KAG7055069.1 hypothetical protein JMJ77_0007538 [Colletotrichum scovillei]KAG7074514.1 hypothetical protein JMJ76_0010992 [Colletotrichum scovillei]KAG7081636.1 hypothetical protein JMJ78_0003754 [Colletotrichum scovillei]
MATTPFDPPLPGSSFFDIYNDGAAQRNPVQLPGGACNYVDLTPGANGAKCGCRRFWSRFAAGKAYTDSLGSDNSVWCMCSHHACFHDDGRAASEAPAPAPVSAIPPTPTTHIPRQENERSRMSREPLSPVQLPDMSFRMPTGYPPTMDFMNLDTAMAISPSKPEEPRPRHMDHVSQRPESTLQDTLSWGDFIQSQPGNGSTSLPPIPAQCLMQSQPSSTTSSSQARYLRPFSGKGLQTLSGVATSNMQSLRKDRLQDIVTSAPQDQFTKDDASAMIVHSDHGADTPRALSPCVRKEDAVFAGPSRDTFRNLSDTVQGHEHRLERLENVSFSAAGHDECHEKHDATDLRVTDLEVRFEEVEKLINDNGSVVGRLADRQTFDESTNSVVSVATSTTTARAGHSGEIFSQIQTLQSQILQLQSQLPTLTRPWEIEVVYLPFPLRRVWVELQDFKSDGTSSLDEWTQMPNTMSSHTLRAQSPFCAEWADPGHDYAWLMAKACSPTSIINSRLKSRGLVRTISIRGSDARSVQAAIHTAFGTAFTELSGGHRSASRRRSLDNKTSRFLGLQQPWVPLRKIHKDSRLRFLTPAEMVTPALWDVSFLNSVIMRSSEPRLFITQPEAYLQDLPSYESGWSWQRLREMSRFYPDSQATQEVPEADAKEDHWTWHDHLDETASAPASLNMRQAGQRVSASPSLHHIAIQSSMRSSSPMAARGQTPVRDGRITKPPYIRTASLPPSVPANMSPSQIKRRVSSFGQRAAVPVRPNPPNISTAYKRRRTTRSPSRPLNTPRWTVSPSPMPGVIPSDERHPSTRGITPHYYATPYSNAPLGETRPRGTGVVVDDSPPDDDENLDPDYGSTNPYDDDDDSDYSIEMVARVPPEREGDSSFSRQVHLPEDEPWPGIEDQEHMSDGENIDPLFSPTAEDDVHSEVSSQPSEYPSTQRGWQVPGADNGVGFRIHEDTDRMQHGWN